MSTETRTQNPMMECGHAANATTVREGKPIPCCAICGALGAVSGWDVISTIQPAPDRVARCSYYGRRCRGEAASSSSLAFFQSLPGEAFDRYYCGCWGWD